MRVLCLHLEQPKVMPDGKAGALRVVTRNFFESGNGPPIGAPEAFNARTKENKARLWMHATVALEHKIPAHMDK